MESPLTAIEMTGTVDEQHQLTLDADLPVVGPQRVKVILMYPLSETWDEQEWLRAAATNPAFADLADEEEDIYTLSDGKPFHNEA